MLSTTPSPANLIKSSISKTSQEAIGVFQILKGHQPATDEGANNYIKILFLKNIKDASSEERGRSRPYHRLQVQYQ